MKMYKELQHVASTREEVAHLNRFFTTWERERPTDYESVLKFIRRLLKQYHLNYYQEADILNEAYRRAVDAIRCKKEITNIPGWMRSTSLRIVQENSKKEKSQQKLTEKLKSHSFIIAPPPSIKEDSSINKRYGKLIDIMNELDEETQLIFRMKEVEELSWSEIKKRLKLNTSLSTLRKRHQRLKDSLKINL